MSIKWNLKRGTGVSLGKIVPVHTMKKLGRGIAPLILNLTARRSCQLHAPTAAPPGLKPLCLLDITQGGPRNKSGNFGRQIKFLLLPIAGWVREPPTPPSPTPRRERRGL